jgi:hypothetical protein
MKINISSLLILISFVVCSCKPEQDNKHLFILSGQSNMQGIPVDNSFIPTLETKLGKNKIIIVKYAQNGSSIRLWDTSYKSTTDTFNLYDTLLNKIHAKIKRDPIQTITFIWMQGESDAKNQLGTTYEKSLINLYNQLSDDLKRKDINFIIGRLNDFDMTNEKFPHWTMIRNIQMNVAKSNPKFDWVNTDDLNDDENNKRLNTLHLTKKGYELLGKRFADKAMLLIENNK